MFLGLTEYMSEKHRRPYDLDEKIFFHFPWVFRIFFQRKCDVYTYQSDYSQEKPELYGNEKDNRLRSLGK